MLIGGALAALASIGGGWWQTRTLVQGTVAVRTTLVCIDPAGAWFRPVLPPVLLAGCDRRPPRWPVDVGCARGGRLTITGSLQPERFDVVVRRSGPVAAHPDAVALLHIEGVRIAVVCPDRGRAPAR